MYQHFNTRKKLIQRVITYCLMALAVIIGVAGTTAWIMGYRVNFQEEQSVERITLLQFGSSPTGADVFVNDDKMSFRTPGRYDAVHEGENVLKYQLEGYHNWQVTVDLKPAEVYWFNYARMVPNKIISSNVFKVNSFYQALAAPNGSYILLHETANSPKFKIIDISDPNNIRTNEIELPESLLTNSVKNIKIVEWDSSSNFVLLNQDGNILRLDRRDVAKSQNLSELFGASISKPHFLNGNNNTIFGITDGTLRRFDIKAKSVSAPLVSNVVSYEVYGDGKLSYISRSKGKQSNGVYFKDKDYIVHEYDEIKAAFTSFTNYYREDFFLSTYGNQIEVVKNPFSEDNKEITTVKIPFIPEHFFHNGGGRMVVATSGNQVFTYDLETHNEHHFDLESFTGKPFWLDDFHLGYIHDGELKMIEFSGDNRESLVPAHRFGVFSDNNEHLFSFRTTKAGTFFVDSSMLAEPKD